MAINSIVKKMDIVAGIYSETPVYRRTQKGILLDPSFYFTYYNMLRYCEQWEPSNPLLNIVSSTDVYYSYILKRDYYLEGISMMNSLFPFVPRGSTPHGNFDIDDIYTEQIIEPTYLLLTLLEDYGINYYHRAYQVPTRRASSYIRPTIPLEFIPVLDALNIPYVPFHTETFDDVNPIFSSKKITAQRVYSEYIHEKENHFNFTELFFEFYASFLSLGFYHPQGDIYPQNISRRARAENYSIKSFFSMLEYRKGNYLRLRKQQSVSERVSKFLNEKLSNKERLDVISLHEDNLFVPITYGATHIYNLCNRQSGTASWFTLQMLSMLKFYRDSSIIKVMENTGHYSFTFTSPEYSRKLLLYFHKTQFNEILTTKQKAAKKRTIPYLPILEAPIKQEEELVEPQQEATLFPELVADKNGQFLLF